MPPQRAAERKEASAGLVSVIRRAGIAMAVLVAFSSCVVTAEVSSVQSVGDLFSLLQTIKTNFNISIEGV